MMGLLSMNSSLWPFSQNAPVKSISKLVLKPSNTCVGMRKIGILNGQFFYTCQILVVRTVLRLLTAFCAWRILSNVETISLPLSAPGLEEPHQTEGLVVRLRPRHGDRSAPPHRHVSRSQHEW